MKVLLLSVVIAGVTLISSCGQCYDCKTSTQQNEYCQNSAEYELLKENATFTDANGEQYVCTLK